MGQFSITDSKLVAAMRRAQRVVVLTGAGISAESGVPTFRDVQSGLWQQFKPEDLATPEAFHRNPRLVWEWHESRRRKTGDTRSSPPDKSSV
jgi:NAD-dependent deacetylase